MIDRDDADETVQAARLTPREMLFCTAVGALICAAIIVLAAWLTS